MSRGAVGRPPVYEPAVGQRRGDLTVVEIDVRTATKKNLRAVRCRCEACGLREVIVDVYRFFLAPALSCGCVRVARTVEPGMCFGRLTVVEAGLRLPPRMECGRVKVYQAARCSCDCGGGGLYSLSELWQGKRVSCGCICPRRNELSYGSMHKRIRAVRGPAANQTCIDCEKPAAHWAYDHTDPSPSVGFAAKGIQVQYSQDADRYDPLCRSCHAKRDNRRLAKVWQSRALEAESRLAEATAWAAQQIVQGVLHKLDQGL